MGQHLVNLKCMYPTQSEADVFYSTRITWAVLPLFIPFCATLIWLLLSRVKHIVRFHSKMKATVVALLFLMWPGLCSETFAMFSCRDVCEETLLRVDLDETCWEGRHAGFAYFLGVPMLIFDVIGLPTCALVGVWRVQKRAADRGAKIETLDGHLTFGLFYSAYDPKVWWWESTVAARKIGVAAIGVFGLSMGDMQVHITAWLMVVIIVLTAIVQPFGQQKLLQFLEMGTLLATWMTLWAGTVFNSNPKCENDEGGTIAWCDALSVLVGLLDIVMAFVAIAVVVYFTKQKECDACCGRLKDETVGQRRRESVARETERRKSRMDSKEVTSFVNPTLDLEKRNAVPELGIEMTSSSSEHANESANGSAGKGKGEEKGEEKGNDGEEGKGGGEVTVTLETHSMHATRAGAAVTAPETVTPNAARARWNTLKQATRASRAFRRGGKQRMKTADETFIKSDEGTSAWTQ